MHILYYAFAAVCVVLITAQMIKNENGGRSLALSGVSGIASVFAVRLAGLITGVAVAVNWYTLAASALLGIPGVIAMLILNIFLK